MMKSIALQAVCLLALAGFAPPGDARDRLQFDRQTPVVKVYERTHKTVVNVSGEQTISRQVWPGFDQFDGWGPRYEQQVPVLGSGVVVHEDGFIVTNAHVVEGVKRIKVVFSDGREFQAQIVSVDANKDLAVLTIKTDEKLPFVELGRSNDLMIGEMVIAIGNPYGYSNTVTSGVVSAVGRDIQVTEGYWLRGLIQTDAPINPGNSGGPLLNVNGQLIGVTTAIRAEAQNIGFAIPVDMLVDNLSHMLMPEKLRRVRLGLTMGPMQSYGPFTGVVVDSVSKGSPADAKGLAAGDLITAVDGHRIRNIIDFYVRMMNKDVAEPIRVTYIRPKEARPASRVVELALLPRPLPDGRLLARSYFQMDVSELTAAVARRFDFRSAYPILIVTDVDARGIAGQTGVQPGDLLLQVNDATVRNLEEFSLEMEKVTEGDTVEFKILRISIGLFGQIERRFLVRLPARALRPTGAPL
ncbi:MAG: trypsin-like peptidase domain-containing protein [Sedimentisphaerales bacterium]|nr:trypsin-like peptidase domain-containing protein [Sedimentisphaerales bacterium]